MDTPNQAIFPRPVSKHHGQPQFWTVSMRDGDKKARTLPCISPPPLKRQRTNHSGHGSSPMSRNNITSLPVRAASPQPLRPVLPYLSFTAAKGGQEQHKHSGNDLISPYALVKDMGLEKFRNFDETPLSNSFVRTDMPTEPCNKTHSFKRKCGVCKKSSNKHYDPIIHCSSCQRSYHDGCRRPPLQERSNPASWRCSICITVPSRGSRNTHNSSQRERVIPETPQTQSPQQQTAHQNIMQQVSDTTHSIKEGNASFTMLLFPLDLTDSNRITTKPISRENVPTSAQVQDEHMPGETNKNQNGLDNMFHGCSQEAGVAPSNDVKDTLLVGRSSVVDNFEPSIAIETQHPPATMEPIDIGRVVINSSSGSSDDGIPALGGILPQAHVPLGRGSAYSHLKQGLYSYRELIGMALLAKGPSLSTSELQDWISKRFPTKYVRGVGSWEKSISATASGNDDFRGERRGDGLQKSWSFSCSKAKAAYVKIFEDATVNGAHIVNPSLSKRKVERSSFHAKANAGHHSKLNSSEPAAESRLKVQNPKTSRVHSLFRHDLSPLDMSTSTITASHSRRGESCKTYVAEIHGIQMPFLSAPKLNPPSEDTTKNRSYSNFFQAFPEYLQPPADTWTQLKRSEKIAEIQKRPSKKSMFGKRLAFARLHRRDVHDENAEKRQHFMPPATLATQVDSDSQTVDLCKFFNIPQNPIPIIHDGQLAFRDGNLANGRLPRPKMIYKIGKKIGGELTTSF